MESESDPDDRPRLDPAEPKVAASLDSQGNGQNWLCLPSPWAFLRLCEGFGFSRPSTIAHQLPSCHHEWISHRTELVPTATSRVRYVKVT